MSSTVWCWSIAEVALAAHVQVEDAVLRDVAEHVVEEADAGLGDELPDHRGSA